MAKKLFGLSLFLWGLIALVVLFFVYGVGRREGLLNITPASEGNNLGRRRSPPHSPPHSPHHNPPHSPHHNPPHSPHHNPQPASKNKSRH